MNFWFDFCARVALVYVSNKYTYLVNQKIHMQTVNYSRYHTLIVKSSIFVLVLTAVNL